MWLLNLLSTPLRRLIAVSGGLIAAFLALELVGSENLDWDTMAGMTILLAGLATSAYLMGVSRTTNNQKLRAAAINELKDATSLAIRHSVADHTSFAWISREFPTALMPTSSYSMCPKNIATLLDIVERTRPSLVVELGCGASTLLIAESLRRNCSGRLISFEHDKKWADQCLHYLSKNQLEATAEIRIAPLRQMTTSHQDCQWYDLSSKRTDIAGIDLLVVDGPPATEIPTGRLPALIEFEARLGPNPVVFLDDGAREGETKVIQEWTSLFPNYEATYFPSSTGYWLLERSGS